MEFEVIDDRGDVSASDEAQARAVWKAALLRQLADDIMGGAFPASDGQDSRGPQIDPAVFALSVLP
jgi:hypothetical protein